MDGAGFVILLFIDGGGWDSGLELAGSLHKFAGELALEPRASGWSKTRQKLD